ncbi:uncharacterized protein [Pagrus major]|uniref:uncharacterized protein isoform X2 n=1 Tax=Pagrus major TaxID=143350 RepID=UPI003CC84D7D
MIVSTGKLHVSSQNLTVQNPTVQNLTVGGGDLILQCPVHPRVDLSAQTVDVKRPDLKHVGTPGGKDVVHAYRHQQDYFPDQMDQYKGRTTLSHEDLKEGIVTLRISSVEPSDSGRYKIFVPRLFASCLVDVTVAVKEDQQNRTNTSTSGPPVEDVTGPDDPDAAETRRGHIPSVCAVVVVVVLVLVLILVKSGKIRPVHVHDRTGPNNDK